MLWARAPGCLVLSAASECELRGWTPPPPGTDVHTLESTLVLSSNSMLPRHVGHHRPHGKIRHTNTQTPQNNQSITMNTNQQHWAWTLQGHGVELCLHPEAGVDQCSSKAWPIFLAPRPALDPPCLLMSIPLFLLSLPLFCLIPAGSRLVRLPLGE